MDTYSLATLRDRDFAFDGTVVSISDPGAEGSSPFVDVAFDVREWFAGDGTRNITVRMLPPGQTTSVDQISYTVGTRLLISGEPQWGGQPLDSPVAWACGFSRTYDSRTAHEWREAMSSAPSD